MMRHSEGPWTAEGPDEFGDYNIHEPGIRAVVAAVISNLRQPAEVAANARLIASAPELKAAVELAYGLLWVVGCNKDTPDGSALYLARKVLFERLDRDGQMRGITAAREFLTKPSRTN